MIIFLIAFGAFCVGNYLGRKDSQCCETCPCSTGCRSIEECDQECTCGNGCGGI